MAEAEAPAGVERLQSRHAFNIVRHNRERLLLWGQHFIVSP